SDAFADARNRHYQPAHLRADRGPDRTVTRTLAEFLASSGVPAALFLGGRTAVAVRRDGPVRPGSGRYRPDVHAHCSGVLSRRGSWNARRACAVGDPG